MSKHVHVVINPASGADRPILNTLNTVFRGGDLEWSVSLTKKSGDAQRFARKAAQEGADVVAIYGGDGSVMEAASGLMGSDVPVAILPGGTANVFSVELGIPGNLAKAAALVSDEASRERVVDMGRLNGEQLFILRLATGFEAIAVGYSLRFPDDLENIERQFEVYDALYAWCRLDVAKSGE